MTTKTTTTKAKSWNEKLTTEWQSLRFYFHIFFLCFFAILIHCFVVVLLMLLQLARSQRQHDKTPIVFYHDGKHLDIQTCVSFSIVSTTKIRCQFYIENEPDVGGKCCSLQECIEKLPSLMLLECLCDEIIYSNDFVSSLLVPLFVLLLLLAHRHKMTRHCLMFVLIKEHTKAHLRFVSETNGKGIVLFGFFFVYRVCLWNRTQATILFIAMNRFLCLTWNFCLFELLIKSFVLLCFISSL